MSSQPWGLDSFVNAAAGISFLEKRYIAHFIFVSRLDTYYSRVVIFLQMNQTENLYICKICKCLSERIFVPFIRVIIIFFSVSILDVSRFL